MNNMTKQATITYIHILRMISIDIIYIHQRGISDSVRKQLISEQYLPLLDRRIF